MSKVLFIDIDLNIEKLGIMYVSAALINAGHETMLCHFGIDNIDEIINDFKPDFLAFSVLTGTHKQMLKIAKDLRSKYKLKVIVGGAHATFFSKDITEDNADYIVVGQGEKAIVDIVNGIVRQRIIQYEFSEIDSISFPDREIFYRLDHYRNNPIKNVITVRDCPYSCSYCYNHSWKNLFKKESNFLKKRSVDNVIQEIKQIKQNYPLEKVNFIDDNFLFNLSWVEEFCLEYKEEINLPFMSCFSLNLLNESLLIQLKNAGLVMVNFAIESATPSVQKDILNRAHISNDQIINAIYLLKKYGIKSRMQNMIGLPIRNSLEDALFTLEFNKKNRVADSWVSIFQPYPNTKLAEYSVQNGYCDDVDNSFAPSFFDRTYLKIDNPDKINRLQKWWYFIVRYNISKKNIRLLLEIPLSETILSQLMELRYSFSRKYLYDLKDADNEKSYSWSKIESKFSQLKNFSVFKNLIQKYRLSYGLVRILMSMELPSHFDERTF